MSFSSHVLSRAAAAGLLGLAAGGGRRPRSRRSRRRRPARPLGHDPDRGDRHREDPARRRRPARRRMADLKKLQDQRENELRRQGPGAQGPAGQDQRRPPLARPGQARRPRQAARGEGDPAAPRAGRRQPRARTRSATTCWRAIDERVMPVINQVGKELGYTLIFRKFESGLIYADDGGGHHQRSSSSGWTPPPRASSGRVAYRLAELAELVGGRVEGDPERVVEAIRSLEAAGPRDLSFLKDPRYRGQAAASARRRAAGGRRRSRTRPLGRDLLDRRRSVLMPWRACSPPFHPAERRAAGGPSRRRSSSRGCAVDPAAHVGPYAVIGAGSRIGAGAAVLAFVAVGRGCTGGGGGGAPSARRALRRHRGGGAQRSSTPAWCWGPTASAMPPTAARHHKVPQVGRVVLEADVEVGANTTIDRATLGETRIGAGTKIDNLVQVGHNVQVGRHCILCGQAGIAGSARLGDGVVLAGQAGCRGTSSSATASRWRPSRRPWPRSPAGALVGRHPGDRAAQVAAPGGPAVAPGGDEPAPRRPRPPPGGRSRATRPAARSEET